MSPHLQHALLNFVRSTQILLYCLVGSFIVRSYPFMTSTRRERGQAQVHACGRGRGSSMWTSKQNIDFLVDSIKLDDPLQNNQPIKFNVTYISLLHCITFITS